MHELSMTNSIIETVTNEAGKRKAKSVLEVKLVVGKFTMLGIEQLRYCFKLLTKDTPLEHSKLKIEREEGKVRCEVCKFEGPIQFKEDPQYHLIFPSLECPRCGSAVELIAGRSCYIRSIKLRS